MSKLISALVILWIFFTFFQGTIDGEGGFNATNTLVPLTTTNTTVTVADTSGFTVTAGNRVIFVEDEEMTYLAITPTTFTGVVRATNGTKAVEHSTGVMVYSRDSATMNFGLNYNIGSTGSTTGSFSVMTGVIMFFVKSIPNLVAWNFSFLDGGMILFRLLLMAVSIGIIIVLLIQFLQTAQSILLR